MTLRAPPQWPMPEPSEQTDAMLLAELSRIAWNNATKYTRDLSAELDKRRAKFTKEAGE